jgi:uncharacterized protein (DUF2267 family)
LDSVTVCGRLVAVTVALKVRLAGEAPKVAAAALPVSATVLGVCAVGGEVLMLSAPVNPLPTVCDENARSTVQLCPAASAIGTALQLPPGTRVKRGEVDSAVRLISTSLLLDSVTVCGRLVAVTVALKVRLAGEAPKVAAAALPVSATVAGANTPDGLLLTLREPVKPLPTVCDENVTCTLQLLPSASTNGSAGQLPPALTANRGVVASAVTLIAAPLTLLRVTGCGALVAVTVALKLKLLGDRLAPLPAHAGSANSVSSAGKKPWPIFHRIRPCRMACSAVISAEVTRRVQQSSRGWRNSGEQ